MLAAAVAAALALAAGAPTPPAPTRWVEDHAGLIQPATVAQLDRTLEGYERATGHQVIVWIGDSLDGAALDEWATRTFAAWQLGRQGHDDGVAVFVHAADRTIAIEVGYGLEDRVTDLIAAHVIRDVMAPSLRAGEPDRAVIDGVATILEAIEGQPWAGAPPAAPVATQPSTMTMILGGVAALALLVLAIRNPRQALLLLWAMSRGLGRGGGGIGRGGGFRGGGGRSGGGGGRGSW